MKVTWETDGTTSKSKVIFKDDSKICSECEGYDGHFSKCSKLKEIIEKEKIDEQIRLLKEGIQERINEAFKKDLSHTERLSQH